MKYGCAPVMRNSSISEFGLTVNFSCDGLSIRARRKRGGDGLLPHIYIYVLYLLVLWFCDTRANWTNHIRIAMQEAYGALYLVSCATVCAQRDTRVAARPHNYYLPVDNNSRNLEN